MNVLLISEDKLRTYSSLNDNVYGKYILPSIKTAQDIELKQIIGSCLLNKLCDLVNDGTITATENSQYKYLLDEYIQPYLIYITLAHLVTEVSTKLTNFGTVQSSDEHLVNVSLEERDLVKQQYTYYSDSYAKQMASFLKANKQAFPELNCGCNCSDQERPHLDSFASIGLWTGGIRSRILK